MTSLSTMETRLSLLCKGVIEVVTLAAVVLAPLFFNTTSATVFELDKAVLVRALAWLAALAWLIQRLETRGRTRSVEGGSPLSAPRFTLHALCSPLPAALVILAVALATLVSIAPPVSFWGLPQRAQGFYTILGYVVLFLAAHRALQTRDQVARLLTAVVVTSLPVALYALAQVLELDPIRWPAEVVGRPSSSVGNPIFLAEYLAMVLPLTIAALVSAWRGARRPAGLSRYLVTGGLVILVALQLVGLQLAAIVVAQSRGPFLGLLAGVAFLGLLLAAFRGDRRLLGRLIIGGLAAFVLLFLINLPGSPLAAVRQIPYVGRLTRLLEPASGTGQQRIMQWEAGVDLVTSDPVRLLVGHGPDATAYVVGPFTPADLINLTEERRTDRLHNEFLDVLATGGLVSLLAHLLLFLSAMRLGLSRLGLLGRGRREALVLAAASLGGGLLAGVAAWAFVGSRAYLAPAFGFGLGGGLGLYLLARPFFADTAGPKAEPRIQDRDDQVLVAGLLAALAGHLVALQFSFGVVTTRMLFWIYLALLAAPAVQVGGTPPSVPPAGRRRRQPRREAVEGEDVEPAALLESAGDDRLARSLVLGLILGVLLADFLLTGVDLWNPTLLGLAGLTWVLGGALTLAQAGGGVRLNRSALSWPVVSLGWGLLFPLLLAFVRLRPVLDPTVFYLLFLAWLGLTLGALALTLSGPSPKRLPLWRSGRWPAYLGLTLIACLAILLTNVNFIQADINFKMAQILRDSGRWDLSIAFHQRAINLAPHHDGYYSSLAQIYLSRAMTARDAEGKTAAVEEALKAMRRATELAPRDATHFWNLGRMYRLSAEQTAEPATRRTWLEQALDGLSRAVALEPNRADLYVEQAQVYLALERYEEAVEAGQQALARDDRSTEAYVVLGDAHLGLGQPALAQEGYRQALVLKMDSVEAHRGLAMVHLKQGAPEAAREEVLAALRLAPNDYASLRTLALAYQALGSIQDALNAARVARTFAPPGQQAALDALIAELEEAQTR